MFTGLIEKIGELKYIKGPVIAIQSGYTDLAVGESIAVDGVCLTVDEFSGGEFRAQMSDETLKKTTLSSIKKGSHVHLERALKTDGRMGGHIVQGHIDDIGKIVRIHEAHNNNVFEISIPEPLLPYVAVKGSIALDGISLTVSHLKGPTISTVLIPHTLKQTHWHRKIVGSFVNIETDILAKYVERHLTNIHTRGLFQKKEITLDALIKGGFE